MLLVGGAWYVAGGGVLLIHAGVDGVLKTWSIFPKTTFFINFIVTDDVFHVLLWRQVRAEQSVYDACDNVIGFDDSEEYVALQALLAAYNDRNQEAAARVLNQPVFKYMDTVYARLARTLRVPGFVDSRKQNAASGVAVAGNPPVGDPSQQEPIVVAARDNALPSTPGGEAARGIPAAVDEDFDLCW